MPEDTRAAVKALIQRGDSFLALRTDAEGSEPRWGLPGGRIEPGERPEEALHREVMEETCLEIEIHDPVGVFHFTWNGTQIVPTVFGCSLVSGTPDTSSDVPGDENIVRYEWVGPEEFLERRAVPSLKQVIQDCYGLG